MKPDLEFVNNEIDWFESKMKQLMKDFNFYMSKRDDLLVVKHKLEQKQNDNKAER